MKKNIVPRLHPTAGKQMPLFHLHFNNCFFFLLLVLSDANEVQDFSHEHCFKHSPPLLLCIAFTYRLNPKRTHKRVFPWPTCPAKKMFDPSAVLLPASVCLHDLFPLGNAPVFLQTNTDASSVPLFAPPPNFCNCSCSAFQFFFSPPAGSCSRCRLCTASFVVLVGLQIMCQALTVNGSLLLSLLSAKHK